jgi:hypothetical protein
MSYSSTSNQDTFGSKSRFEDLERMAKTPRRDQGGDIYSQKKRDTDFQDDQDKYGT